MKARTLFSRVNMPEARTAFEQAFELAKVSGGIRIQIVALQGSGLTLRYQGFLREAEEKLQAARRLTERGIDTAG